MKWRLYDQVLPRHLLQGEAEDVAAFAVTIGFPCPGGLHVRPDRRQLPARGRAEWSSVRSTCLPMWGRSPSRTS